MPSTSAFPKLIEYHVKEEGPYLIERKKKGDMEVYGAGGYVCRPTRLPRLAQAL